MRAEWSREERTKRSRDIRIIKEDSQRLFSNYQSSRIATINFHPLEYLVKSLWAVGSIEYLHAGFYEWSHKNFKRALRKTFQRHTFALRKV